MNHIADKIEHSTRNWKKDLLAIFIILLVCLASLSNLIVPYYQLKARYIIHWDLLQYDYPVLMFFSDALRKGIIPLWNPFEDCGFPIMGDPQTQLWYPITLIISLLPGYSIWALQLEFVFTFFLAGLCAYIAARGLRLLPSASLLTALSYMLSGIFVGSAPLFGMITAYAWFPLVFILFLKAIETNRVIFCMLSAVALAVTYLAGHPAVVAVMLLNLAGLVFYKILLILKEKQGFDIIFKVLGKALLVLILAFALCAIHLFPTVELSRHDTRIRTLPYEHVVMDNPLLPRALVTMILPAVGVTADMLLKADISMTNFYMGIGGLIMALTAVALYRNPFILFLLIISFLNLLAAFGPQGFIRVFLYQFVPFFDMFRHPSGSFRGFSLFYLAILAGYGFHYLISEKRENIRDLLNKSFLGLVKLTVIGGFFISIVIFLVIVFYRLWKYEMLLTFADEIVIFSLFSLAFYLALYSFLNKKVWVKTFIACFIAFVIWDLSAATQRCFKSIADEAHTVTWKIYLDREARRPQDFYTPACLGRHNNPTFTAYFNFNYIEKYANVLSYNPIRLEHYMKFINYPSNVELLGHYGSSFPRVFMTRAALLTHDSNRNLAKEIALRKIDLQKFVYLTKMPASGKNIVFNKLPPSFLDQEDDGFTTATIKCLKYTPTQIEYDVETPTEGFLFTGEIYYPGWTAMVDDQKVEVLQGNYIFRVNYVPKGRHSVVYKFEPLSFRLGSYITLLTLTFIIAMFLFFLATKQQEKTLVFKQD